MKLVLEYLVTVTTAFCNVTGEWNSEVYSKQIK